jgi:hypothetical protein
MAARLNTNGGNMKARANLVALISVMAILWSSYQPASNVQASGDRGHHDDFGSDLPLREEETIRKSFNIGSAHKLLDVDNVFGSIEVVGGPSDQVQLVITRTNRAESQSRMEAAKKEVTLDITEEPDLLKLYVNGPFRCNCSDNCVSWRGDDHGYAVKMDFQLEVPRRMDLKLRTVNSGHINVRGVTGNFSVHNVNGGIDLEDVGGGKALARTVNGGVKVVFRENPKENSDFGTINGPVDLYFARGLSADFRFKTMNGHIYSDFEMTSLPAKAATSERHDGKFVFRTDRYTGGRVGAGGMEIKADNLNGDIRVLERHE